MRMNNYKELWENTPSQAMYCVEKAIFVIRTVLNGDKAKRDNDVTAEKCFGCKQNFINGGICDPI